MSVGEVITYIIMFLAVYVQLFLLVTFFERRKELKMLHDEPAPVLHNPPKVAIILPCWNEEKTVHGTIESLLALDYPREKLEIIAVDDGSTDSTWQELMRYEGHPHIKLFQKENGGKHTAVNFGIERTDAAIIGCLDADSFVMPDTLKRIIGTFEQKPYAMAVAPSLIIHNPKNILQYVQRVEYNMSTYNKKMLAFLGAIHVTPGPFSLFRREVFEKIGLFRAAHNTEDQEIAYRMQEHHLPIEHCHNAYVHTSSPDTLRKLYKQRLRWIYGFIQNTVDYRRLIFKSEHGNFSLFTLPSGIISIVTVVYLTTALLYNLIVFCIERITKLLVAGFQIPSFAPHLEWFYINTHTIMFVTAVLYMLLITAIVIGTRLNRQGNGFDWYIIPYILIYSIVAPFWLLRAVWNSVVNRQPTWR